jgi:acyl-CoA synthetase (AMP-forming)/AMP-acid ligase II
MEHLAIDDRWAGLLEHPTGSTIHDLLEAVANRNRAARAISDPDSELSYCELTDQVDVYAKALLAQGVRRGDRVAMLAPPGNDFLIVLHAAVSIGAIWLGINPRYQRRDFEYLLGDSDPAVLIVSSPFDGRDYCSELTLLLKANVPLVCHGEPTAGAVSPQAFLARGAGISDADLAAARAAVEPEDTAVVVYTSGTTGKPKGAMLSHRAIVSSAMANAAWMGRKALARCLCAAPINHVAAINNVCMNVLAGEGTVIFYPRVDLAVLGELNRRELPTFMISSPTYFSMLLANPEEALDHLKSVKLIVFGGAATSRSVLEKIAPCGSRLVSIYGQTESCGIITRTDETDDLDVLSVTIGKAIRGADLRIVAPDGSACAQGESGEIQIKAPYVTSGYFQNPEATAEAFTADGFLRTGDLGLIREDGNLVIVGRLKEMFKSGGYNIYPVEIEQAMCEHPAVTLAAVVSVAHPTFQEVGFAFVQPEPGASLVPDELCDFLRQRIANYKIPKYFAIEAELPKLPNYKIDKMALKSRVASVDLALLGKR